MSENNWKFKRYVVGRNAQGKSCVLFDKATNVFEDPGILVRADLWRTYEMPVDNTIMEDRSLLSNVREPPPRGTVFRSLDVKRFAGSHRQHREIIERHHRLLGAKHMPSEEDYAKNPMMHKTDTIDYGSCLVGERLIITEVDEVLMRPGDTSVILGVNHAFTIISDRSLGAGVMISSKPLP